jgi:hypothetical protein
MFSHRTHGDFHDEVQSHLDLEADRLIADGMSPDEARAEARRRFGNVANVEERFYEASRGLARSSVAGRAIRVRGQWRSPSFVLTTTLTLAVAIGLLTTAFAVVNGFLRPYAIRDPGGLCQISWRARESGSPLFRWSDYDEFHRRTDLFSAVVGENAHMVSSSGQPVLAAVVSLDYFDALGPAMRLGRGLAPIDARERGRAERSGVAVIFDRDRDPDRDIELNGRIWIVGVLGPEFSGLVDQPRDVFVPRPAGVSAGDGTPDPPPHGTMIVARLAAGVTVPQAEGALAGFMRARFDREQDVARRRAHPGPNELTLQVIAILTPVFVPLVLVLVTACANVSNVMLARAIGASAKSPSGCPLREPRACRDAALDRGCGLAAIAGCRPRARPGDCVVPELLVNTLPASLGPILRLPRLDFDVRCSRSWSGQRRWPRCSSPWRPRQPRASGRRFAARQRHGSRAVSACGTRSSSRRSRPRWCSLSPRSRSRTTARA